MLFSQQTTVRLSGAHLLLLLPLVSRALALIKQPLPNFYIAALGSIMRSIRFGLYPVSTELASRSEPLRVTAELFLSFLTSVSQYNFSKNSMSFGNS